MPRSLTDAFKVVAAIAVVGIHATSQSETRFAANHDYLSLDFISVLVNQWARFSVPLFIYFSGYGLTKADRCQQGGFLASWGDFLWLRLPTILLPYAFYSAVALMLQFHNYRDSLTALWPTVADKLRTGGADYHLYFLVILTQSYLAFSLLVRTAKFAPRAYEWTTWIAMVLVSGLLYKGSSEVLLPALVAHHPGWHASFVIYWLPYFMLGISHAVTPPRKWPKPVAGVAVVAAFLFVLAEYIHYSRLGTPVDYYNHFSRPSVMLYALVVVWWLHSVSPSASSTSPAPAPFDAAQGKLGGEWEGDILTRLAKLAPLTFAVYLIHPQILRLVNAYLSALPTFFSWLLVVISSFLLVHLLVLITGRLHEKGPGFLTGPVALLQRCLGLR